MVRNIPIEWYDLHVDEMFYGQKKNAVQELNNENVDFFFFI